LHGRATFCCGAGGGQLFVSDETKESSDRTRVNVQRLDQLLAAAPDTIAVACPYCPVMLRDAAKARGAQVPILDVAEIVAGRLVRSKGDEVMTARDLVIAGQRYRYLPDGTGFDYLGSDAVRYRRHENGGGLVARTARVAPTVHVGPVNRVFGSADLADSVRLTGWAEVGGTVRASGSVVFCGRTYLTEGEFSGSRIVRLEPPVETVKPASSSVAS
jgi:hypothetical protein